MIEFKVVPPPGSVIPNHNHLPCDSDSNGRPRPGQPHLWLPNHNDLPDKDGSPVTNSQEHPQSRLLTGSIEPLLRQRHPDDQYYLGQDTALFFRIRDADIATAVAPDWYYVPGVSPLYEGEVRRSYILWQDMIVPLIVLEYVSGNGAEERDRTRYTGKFWLYEQGLRVPYYGIYEVNPGRVELYQLVNTRYELVPANDRGHFPIAPPLGLELGIWQGRYAQYELPWLRWWDAQGNLLPSPEERAEQERQRAEQERQRAERLAEKLRALGIDPEAP